MSAAEELNSFSVEEYGKPTPNKLWHEVQLSHTANIPNNSDIHWGTTDEKIMSLTTIYYNCNKYNGNIYY